jgi:FkbM family methyltransferase
MGIKSGMRAIAEKLTGRKIYKRTPFGVNPLDDLVFRFPNYRFEVIFDVGANIGQSAIPFSKRFPGSRIYCFEPIALTFATLGQNVGNRKNIELYQMALGAVMAEKAMTSMKNSDMSTLRPGPDVDVIAPGGAQTEIIKVDTLTGFCDRHSIKHISYLKIDTEGYDLEVIKGGKEILDRSAIDFVELEAGMNPNNKLHVPMEELKEYMENNGYCLFGIYEQVQEWITQKPILRRSNLLFVSDKMANK